MGLLRQILAHGLSERVHQKPFGRGTLFTRDGEFVSSGQEIVDSIRVPLGPGNCIFGVEKRCIIRGRISRGIEHGIRNLIKLIAGLLQFWCWGGFAFCLRKFQKQTLGAMSL